MFLGCFFTQGLPASQATRNFAQELLDWIPRASKGPSAYQERERKAVAFARANQQYALLSDSEDDIEELPPAPTTAPLKGKDKNLRRKKVHHRLKNLCLSDHAFVVHVRVAMRVPAGAPNRKGRKARGSKRERTKTNAKMYSINLRNLPFVLFYSLSAGTIFRMSAFDRLLQGGCHVPTACSC